MPIPLVALPWGSPSISRVRCSATARLAARFTAVVVFPTPPVGLPIAIPRATAADGGLVDDVRERPFAGAKEGRSFGVWEGTSLAGAKKCHVKQFVPPRDQYGRARGRLSIVSRDTTATDLTIAKPARACGGEVHREDPSSPRRVGGDMPQEKHWPVRHCGE